MMKNRPALTEKATDDRGFLLVELLIAGAILAVAAAVILGSITASARAMKHAEMRSRAVSLLQQKSGEVESAGLPRSVSGDFGSRAPGFSWSAEPRLNDCGDNVCPATVTVSWTEHGVEHEVALATMASRKRNP